MFRDGAAWHMFFLKQAGSALEDKKGLYWPISVFHTGRRREGKELLCVSSNCD